MLAHRVVGRAAAAARRRVAAGGRDPAAPHLQLHRRRGAGLRARGAGALGDRPRRPGRRRRRRDPGQQGDRGRPGLAARPRPGRRHRRARRDRAGPCSASAAASRCCAATSTTPWSPGAGGVEGLGLLDADIVFAPDKTLRAPRRSRCAATRSTTASVARSADDDWLGVGIRRGAVYGTHWHGLLDNDDFRRRWLADAAAAAGRHGFVVADDVDVSAPPRRPTRPDGRPAGRPTPTSTPSSACWTPDRPSAPDRDQRAAWVALAP